METIVKEKEYRLRPRHRRFLRAYAECGDIGKAYLSAGYKCKSKDNACKCGSQLLKKLESRLDLEQKFQAMGLGDLELMHIVHKLLYSNNQAVQARIIPHAMRARKWIGSEELGEKGATIIIRSGEVQEESKQEKRVAQVVTLPAQD